jgi:hypothetical protein
MQNNKLGFVACAHIVNLAHTMDTFNARFEVLGILLQKAGAQQHTREPKASQAPRG